MNNELVSGGLSKSTVLRLQEEEGLNEIPSQKPRTFLGLAKDVLNEPVIYLLAGCGGVYLIVGEPQEALMLLGFILLIIAITIFQERKAERAIDALKDLSSPRALVIREGKYERIPGREVVRGDSVLIKEGDRIPADGVLLSGALQKGDIATDESILTGESLPSEKCDGATLFSGTTMVRGRGTMLVKSIGPRTELGKIGKFIQGARREPTLLENQTRALVGKMVWLALAICILVIVVYALTRGTWTGGLLVGLTLAMAILPNELPAVLTIFLALGAWRISQRRVLTRRLPAVENLGAATVLCVDKTGTLTLNQMSVEKVYSAGKYFDFSTDRGSALPEDFHEVLEYGILASRQDPFDPLEIAFISAGLRYLKGTEHLHHDWSLEREYPLLPELLSVTHAWKPHASGGYVVGAKGAPEAIIDLCHLNREAAAEAIEATQRLAKEGLRVIGVAKAFTRDAPLPSKQHDFEFALVGFVGIGDPVRPEVPAAIRECYSAGIRVVMITGDHPLTAASIAKKIGLNRPDSVVTGEELSQTNQHQIQEHIKSVNVFSRVMPDQKLKLVEALKGAGEIVAMTGDGVNDAPALRSAHIGIAMGGRGTDVARESASLVLLDDDFSSIVEAIRMGRRVFINLRSALIYLLAVHIPIAGLSVVPVLFTSPLVLFPAHVALLHLIIEPACSIAFEARRPDSHIMKSPPRNPDEPLLGSSTLVPSISQGTVALIVLLFEYAIALAFNRGEGEARAFVITTMIIVNSLLIFSGQFRIRKKEFRQFAHANQSAIGIAGFSTLVLIILLYVPHVRDLFSLSKLHLTDIAICMGVAILSVAISTTVSTLLTSKNHGYRNAFAREV